MRFLADENFPGSAVTALIDSGHDVEWVRTTSPGISDAQVLARAASEGRIVLTFDKDFGPLVRQGKLPASCGVILFPIPMPRAKDAGARIAVILDSRQDWAGQFSVVTPSQLRMRPLR
jgi:hypothetical protein